MRNATACVVVLLLVLANPTPAAAQDGSAFKPEVDAYIGCINREVLRQQERPAHKIDNASAVIQACSVARSRLRVASGDAPIAEKIIIDIEAHLRMREQAMDEPKM